MRVKIACMNARIGAAAARNGNLLPHLETQAFLQFFLNTIRLWLNLIAMIIGAIVGKMNECFKQAKWVENDMLNWSEKTENNIFTYEYLDHKTISPATMATPSIGMPAEANTMAIKANEPPGTPGVPMEAIVADIAMVKYCCIVKSMPQQVAMKTEVTPR